MREHMLRPQGSRRTRNLRRGRHGRIDSGPATGHDSPTVDDASPEHDDEGQEQSTDYRHDALGELMTGAYAATSMVAMTVEGGDANLPAPPAWSPTDDAPTAEALDETSGVPAQIESGRHPAVEEEIEFDLDEDLDEDAAPEQRDHIGSGPEPARPEVSLRAAIEELPASSDNLVAQLEDEHVPLAPVIEDDPEPAASISTDSGVVVTPQHAKGAQLTGAYATIPAHMRSPAPRKRSPMPWVLGGLAVVLGVGLAMWATTKPQASDEPSEPAEAAVVPSPAPAESEEPAADPGTPEAEPKAPTPEPPETAEVPGDAYAAAAAKYEREPTNEVLLEMTLAACELRRGPDARTAFRKLVGGKARSKAVVECREGGIDVTSKVEGFTAGELAAQAKEALDAGDAEKALELAKQSNKTERNQPALRLVVTAHCHLGQKASAKKMMRHISKRNRRALSKTCAEHGVRIR